MASLADGNSFRTIAALVSGKYGVSERTAQRDLTWARNILVGELSSTEVKELFSWSCHRTQTIFQNVEAAGAYSAAVAGNIDLPSGAVTRAGQYSQQSLSGLKAQQHSLLNSTYKQTRQLGSIVSATRELSAILGIGKINTRQTGQYYRR